MDLGGSHWILLIGAWAHKISIKRFPNKERWMGWVWSTTIWFSIEKFELPGVRFLLRPCLSRVSCFPPLYCMQEVMSYWFIGTKQAKLFCPEWGVGLWYLTKHWNYANKLGKRLGQSCLVPGQSIWDNVQNKGGMEVSHPQLNLN